MVYIKDIMTKIEQLYPTANAESWDNVGLIVGNKENPVTKALVSLDFDIEVAKEAKNMGAEIIITHHPILFSPINKITADSGVGRAIIYLIENKIALYSAHTNMDSSPGGINDYLVNLYGFTDMQHFDIEEGKKFGVSRISRLPKPMKLSKLAKHIAKCLDVPYIYYIGRDDDIITTAYTCSGGGGSLIKPGVADVYITGDLKYSNARNCHDDGLNVIYAGHYETEIHVTELFEKALSSLDIETFISKAGVNIVKKQEL